MERRFVAIVAGVVVLLVVGALVIARDDTSHTPTRLPIAAGGTSGAGGADSALAPYGEIVYHLGSAVPPLDGTARAYRLTADDPAVTQRLASALGMHGGETRDGDTVTVTDGPAQLVVTSHDWSYSLDPNGTVSSSPTSEPAPTDLLPTEAAAKSAALDLVRRAGLDTTGATITTDLGANQWFVRLDPVVDGVPTEGAGATVIVGAKGVVEAASGVLGRATAVDEYPLAGTEVAVDRLNSGERILGEQPLPVPQPATAPESAPTASDEPPATDNAVNEGEASALPPDSGEPRDSEPPSTDTIPPPARQDVTLTGAERVLLFALGTDGTMWLVPAYRFTTADGVGPTVLAVPDQFLLPADVAPTGR